MTPNTAARIVGFTGWGFIIFGVPFVAISFTGYDSFAHASIDFLDISQTHTEVLTRDARLFGAVFAGLITGFGALYAFGIAPLLKITNREANNIAKRAGIIAAIAWFIVDSAGSIASGVWSNAMFNVIYLLLLVVPLALVKFEN